MEHRAEEMNHICSLLTSQLLRIKSFKWILECRNLAVESLIFWRWNESYRNHLIINTMTPFQLKYILCICESPLCHFICPVTVITIVSCTHQHKFYFKLRQVLSLCLSLDRCVYCYAVFVIGILSKGSWYSVPVCWIIDRFIKTQSMSAL